MTQFKGTPGPWEVEDNGYFYDINAGRATVGNVCSSMSWFDNDEHRGPVAMANAQLIAAAPELLEALTVTLDEIGHWLSQQKPELRQKLVSVINKATGETK